MPKEEIHKYDLRRYYLRCYSKNAEKTYLVRRSVSQNWRVIRTNVRYENLNETYSLSPFKRLFSKLLTLQAVCLLKYTQSL